MISGEGNHFLSFKYKYGCSLLMEKSLLIKKIKSGRKSSLKSKTNKEKTGPKKRERVPFCCEVGTRPGTRLSHPPYLITFLWKYIFLNNSGAFKDFRTFFLWEGRKNYLFGLWRWEVMLVNNCFKCHAELSKVLFSLRINNLITYTFVIILTRIGERLDPDC